MASKSAMGFAMSKGLERYKVVLRFPRSYAAARGSPKPVSSFRRPVSRLVRIPVTSLACRMGSTFPQAHFSKTCFQNLLRRQPSLL
jgi:hypothetical protein